MGVVYVSYPTDILYNDIYIYIYHSWVDSRWQQYVTHLHKNSTHNTVVRHTFTHKQYT
jgi:hypothetical protein